MRFCVLKLLLAAMKQLNLLAKYDAIGSICVSRVVKWYNRTPYNGLDKKLSKLLFSEGHLSKGKRNESFNIRRSGQNNSYNLTKQISFDKTLYRILPSKTPS